MENGTIPEEVENSILSREAATAALHGFKCDTNLRKKCFLTIVVPYICMKRGRLSKISEIKLEL